MDKILESGDKIGSTIGVARVIDSANSDENGFCFYGFSPGHGHGEKDGIARRDVSIGDVII